MDEEIITQIGTLEWDMGADTTDIDFTKMRPTTKEDLKYDNVVRGRSYDLPMLKMGASDEDVKESSIQAMMYVTVYILKELEHYGAAGKVLLCFVMHELRWNQKIVCNAYEVQPKQA